MSVSAPRSPLRPRRATRGHASEWVHPAESPIHGRGVFARTVIPDGTRVIEYVGRKISLAEAGRRERARLSRQRRGLEAMVTMFVLNGRQAIDGRHGSNGARLINHSCAPNCRSEIVRGRVWIVARREILPGEEITFDYGYTYREGLQHPCRCGAGTCVGFIISAHQRWLLRRKRGAQRRGQSGR